MAEEIFQLIVREGPKAGQVFTLDLERIVIGRDPLADLVVDDQEVSRHHAVLIQRPGGYDLQDNGSTNGTFVEEQRLGNARVALKPGQHIRLGSHVRLAFRAAPAADPTATMISQAPLMETMLPDPSKMPSLEDTASLPPVELSRNPYVGPRPFAPDERDYFYGRDDEIAILRAQVMARRASLFFAQSGAGKSSLLRAGLFPELTEKKTVGRGARQRTYQKMKVLPILGVGAGVPPGLRSPIANVYVFSALLTLGSTGSSDELAGMTLSQGLAPHLAPEEDAPAATDLAATEHATLLIFDQFEEIFTHDPERWAEREDFFIQVNQALEEYPNLHVLFTMREDFIAELTPYTNILPGGLRARFRLERLKREAALSAVTTPAERAGRIFAEGVAEALVDDLRRSQSGHRRHGYRAVAEVELGAYVEPVHLQIVCRQLWEKLPLRRRIIEKTDVQAFGDVDEALIGFYESSLATAGAQTGVGERQLRNWFTDHLITPARTRYLVYKGETETEGLPNDAVAILNDAYIIRASDRGGETWYELAHDRLVEPIIAANQRWYEEYQNPLDKPTKAWLATGSDPSRLLDGAQLQEAQAYAQTHDHELLPEERRFLTESQRQEKIREEQARSRRRTRRIIFGGGLLFTVALLIASVLALNSARVARDAEQTAEIEAANARAAENNALAAQQLAQEKAVEAEEEAANARAAEAVAEESLAETEIQRQRAEEEAQNAREAQDEAIAQFQEAERQTRRSLAESLSANALIEVAKPLSDPSLALILARESVLITRDTDGFVVDTARRALLESVAVAPPWVANLPPSAPTSGIQDVAFSPDGRRLAAAAIDGSAYIWTLDPWEEILLQGHEDSVSSIAFSPDGARVATASADGSIKLWDASNGRELLTLTGHEGGVNDVAFSPDGSRIASGGDDSQVLIWNAGDGSQLLFFAAAHNGLRVTEVAFSPDGSRLLSAGADNRVVLWDAIGNTYQLAFSHQGLLSAAFSPNGSRVVTTGTDNKARIWNAASGQEITVLEGHPNWVESAAYFPDGNFIITGSDDTTARIWNANTGALLMILSGHAGFVISVAASPDGSLVASGGHDGSVKLWAPGAPGRIPVLDHGGIPVTDGAFGSDGQTIYTLDNSLTIRSWTRDGDSLGIYELPAEAVNPLGWGQGGIGGSDASFSLITEDGEGNVQLWDMDNNQLISTLDGHAAYNNYATMSPDGTRLAVFGCDEADETFFCLRNSLTVWDTLSGQVVNNLEELGFVWFVSFSQDGSRMVSYSEAGIAVWETDSGAQLATFEGNSVEISPDGQQIAIGEGNVARLFDVASGQQLAEFTGHRDVILGLAFSPDSQTLLTASWDSTARVWDAETGFEILALTGHTDQVSSARFSPDGNRILTTSQDGTARIWPFSVDELLALAEPLIQRQPPELTPEEASRFGLDSQE